MIAAVIKGLFLGILLAISVGPIIFAIIKQSINNGHKAGYIFVAGVSSSDVLLLLVCNFFTSLFQSALAHKNMIAISGSIFLVAVGIYTFFFKKVAVDEENNLKEKEFKTHHFIGIYLAGFFMNILNPAVFIFWFVWSAAILADSTQYPNPFEYRVIVFGTCLIFVLLTDILKVAVAGRLRPKLTAKNLHFINKLSGVILIGFGIALCWGVLQFGSLLK
jgi:threonine/homoserine/homoserine lactone efflux protein